MIKILLIIILLIVLLTWVIGKFLSTKPYKGPKSDHFNGYRFKNPSGVSAKGFASVFKYMRDREKDSWTTTENPYVSTSQITDAKHGEIKYVFINHSTFLIQIDGINILTDPIFSDYCSPVPLPPMRRHRPPGIPMDLLPRIDLVLVSHNHYDHMDKWSIKELTKKWNPFFLTALGNKHTLEKMGAKRVEEIDWWQSHTFKEIRITSTPANHFSSRGTFDRNTSLWCGFHLEKRDKKIYFLGDSGYSDIFKEIGDRLGPMDLSLIPIGAFKPRWFMGPIHISPEESLQVHKDVNSKKSIAMHFGTFALADDNPERAIRELTEAKEQTSVSDDEFEIIEEGRIKTLE
jgi:L-ascorbate metabolism protein UlaG (beta-lactamase superfamily)